MSSLIHFKLRYGWRSEMMVYWLYVQFCFRQSASFNIFHSKMNILILTIILGCFWTSKGWLFNSIHLTISLTKLICLCLKIYKTFAGLKLQTAINGIKLNPSCYFSIFNRFVKIVKFNVLPAAFAGVLIKRIVLNLFYLDA